VLKRSAQDDAEWIVSAIERAKAATDPVHDLGWLVVNLPDGSQAWERCRRHLFEKVDPTRRRLLARCIGLFRDAENIDWLRENLSETKHMVLRRDYSGAFSACRRRSRRALSSVGLHDLQMCSAWATREVWSALGALRHDVDRSERYRQMTRLMLRIYIAITS
jgi:hypothetical protein